MQKKTWQWNWQSRKMKRKPNWPMKNLYQTIFGCFWRKQSQPIPRVWHVGPQDWYERRLWTKVLQELQSNTGRTKRIGQIPRQEPGERIHLTISIPYGFSLLLCQKERWEITTLPRLLILKWLDHQKCLSLTIDLWNNGQIKRGKVFSKIWCTMGI